MAFIGSLEDKMAIRELYGSYSDASSRGSVDGFLASWTEDGEWISHIFHRSGKQELRQQWDTLWENFDQVGFLSEICAIEVDGDSARCRTLAREIITLKAGGIYKLIGRYDDELVRQNGTWLFRRRNYQPIVEELPGT